MKALSLITAFVLSSLFALSQNGGVSNENQLLKMEYIGYSNGNQIIQFTNKQTCAVTVEYKIGQSSASQEFQLPASGTWYLNVAAPQSQDLFVKSRAKTFCGSNTDAGWVELKVLGNISLPIVFGPITARKVGPNLIRLTFEAEEDAEIHHYNILVSPDGKTWKKAQVLFPNGITGRKNYSVLVKF